MGILECGAQSIHNFFKFLADIPVAVPIVYGCSLGKDRTGVISYLLLTILNSTSTDIYADYSESKKYLLTDKRVITYFSEKNCSDYYRRCCSACETIRLFEQLIQNKYLAIGNYFNTIEITQNDIKNIKMKWGI
jgi:protein-tyrosine phosphatase